MWLFCSCELIIQLEFFARSNFIHLGYFHCQCACDCEGCRLVTIRKVRITFMKMNSAHTKMWFVKENVSDIYFVLFF
jgi:hypothetical protein